MQVMCWEQKEVQFGLMKENRKQKREKKNSKTIKANPWSALSAKVKTLECVLSAKKND